MGYHTLGDAPVAKRGKHKGGRGKKDKRKKGRAVRTGVVKKLKAAGIKSAWRSGRWT